MSYEVPIQEVRQNLNSLYKEVGMVEETGYMRDALSTVRVNTLNNL